MPSPDITELIDFLADLRDALAWSFWGRWRWRWRHRHDTLAESRDELIRRWDAVLEAMRDEPVGRELQDAMDAMEEVKRSLGGGGRQMIRKVKFGVYVRRDRPQNKVTVTHVGIYINKQGGEFERGVLYHTFNEPNYFTQAMSEKDFLASFQWVGKLLTIHRTEEKVR